MYFDSQASLAKQALIEERANNEKVENFMQGILSGKVKEDLDLPVEGLGATVFTKDAEITRDSAAIKHKLDVKTEMMEYVYADQPEIRAKIAEEVGLTFSSIGAFSEAELLLEKAISINTELYGETVESTLDAKMSMVELLKEQGRYVEAEEQMSELMPEESALIAEMEEEPTHMMPDGTEMPGATHNESQIPDEEMESDYLDFVIGEALTPEDEQYLFDKLNEDDQLSMIFDKVVETASEFSGSGTVEGPGSNVSDSIPARLSDGEFVITSKASNQIGPEVLQELMELAEQEADGEVRQTANTGGLAQTEGTAIVAGASEDERGLAMKNKEAMRLLDPRLSLFAS